MGEKVKAGKNCTLATNRKREREHGKQKVISALKEDLSLKRRKREGKKSFLG